MKEDWAVCCSSCASCRAGLIWVAVKELSFLGNPRFPLKGSFQGDIDIDVDVDADTCFWVAVKELNLSYNNRDIQYIIWTLKYGHLI